MLMIINAGSILFSSLFQLSQQLDGLLGMLCADVAPADGAAIQQTLKHLEEKLKSVGEDIIVITFICLQMETERLREVEYLCDFVCVCFRGSSAGPEGEGSGAAGPDF